MITQEKLGIDERINEAFQPISNFLEGLILHEFFGTGIPTIIFLFLDNYLKTTLFYCSFRKINNEIIYETLESSNVRNEW